MLGRTSGEHIIVRGRVSTYMNELYWGQSSPVWNNGGDTVTVIDGSGETVLNREY